MLQDSMQEDGTSEDAMVPADERGDDSRRRTEASHLRDAQEVRRPLHYRVQFTASQEFVDLLEEVRSLLGHERSGTDLPDVQLRALRALVKELRGKKRAATDRPREQVASRAATDALARESRAESDSTDSPARKPQPARDITDSIDAPARGSARATRHIPARVRRAVFERDASRCAYHDDRGERCRETHGLEIHHRRAHALGGAPTLENLELRCRSHNTLAAEQDFGREHMDWMRGVTEGTALERPF